MENKELFKKSFEKPLKITEVKSSEEDLIVISTEGGDIKIETSHDSDCCEHVYADTSMMKYFTDSLKGLEVSEVIIKGVVDMGYLLVVCHGYEEYKKIFIPCYNSQNGYYSDDLELEITIGQVKTTVDVTEYVEDLID
jgi:hypothetical protein